MSCYDGDWAGTLATTSHSALGCEASGGCELRGDARGERVLSATRRTDCARRRPPSSSHPNIAAQLGERSAGHPAQAMRAARRVAAIDSAAATCCRATTHSSTCSLMELASAITASLVVDEDGALLHRAARYRRGVDRLLAGRADRAERLGHQFTLCALRGRTRATRHLHRRSPPRQGAPRSRTGGGAKWRALNRDGRPAFQRPTRLSSGRPRHAERPTARPRSPAGASAWPRPILHDVRPRAGDRRPRWRWGAPPRRALAAAPRPALRAASPRSAPPNIRDEEVQFFIASIAVRVPLLGVRLPRPRIC